MTESVIETRDSRGVVTLTINRPAQRNALDATVIEAVTAAFVGAKSVNSPAVREAAVARPAPVRSESREER